MYQIPASFMVPFEIVLCSECGLEHAPIRTCEETKLFHEVNNQGKKEA